jgi:hypothetical protein
MLENATHKAGKIWQKVFGVVLLTNLACCLVVNADETASATEKPPAPSTTVDPKADAPSTADAAKKVEIDLLEEDLSVTWKHFSSQEGVPIGEVWNVSKVGEEKQLKCSGEPKGFLYTKKQYANFVLTFEWNVSEANANSGVLVYTQDEPRLWPTSMQVQLHQPQAGDLFPSGDANGNTTQAPPELAKEIGTWNTCRVQSYGGQLSVEINGRKAGEVSGCQPATGFIALQSEGSTTLFRRLKLRELTSPIVQDVPTQSTEVERSVEKSPEPVPAKGVPAKGVPAT